MIVVEGGLLSCRQSNRTRRGSVFRIDADLPPKLYLVLAALALLASLGLMSLAPLPVRSGVPVVPVAILATVLMGGMVMGGGWVVAQVKDQARANAATDPETGLSTPFAAEQALAMEFAAAQRGRPLTVALTRIDQFPQYAARHGEAVAKRLARNVGRVVSQHRRAMHVAAHHGREGTLFLAVLSGVDAAGASVYAKRIRRAVATIPGAPEPPMVTVAIASYDVSMRTPQELVAQAERALRKTGEAGGKIIVVGQAQVA
jgi:diguanylate cyclase (GGDEF)-like protein